MLATMVYAVIVGMKKLKTQNIEYKDRKTNPNRPTYFTLVER